jgi:hypothetical protein
MKSKNRGKLASLVNARMSFQNPEFPAQIGGIRNCVPNMNDQRKTPFIANSPQPATQLGVAPEKLFR